MSSWHRRCSHTAEVRISDGPQYSAFDLDASSSELVDQQTVRVVHAAEKKLAPRPASTASTETATDRSAADDVGRRT